MRSACIRRCGLIEKTCSGSRDFLILKGACIVEESFAKKLPRYNDMTKN